MMLRSSMRVSALFAISMIAHAYADPAAVKGETFRVQKNKVTGIPGFFKSSNHRAPACPPPVPTIPINSSVPLPNPNALPGAFFPNPLVSNSLTPPPQTVGVNFIAGIQGLNPTFLGTPPDTFGVKGLTQFVVGDNNGVVSFDPVTGKRDNIIDTENATLANLDGDFTIFISNHDARIHYDRLANRFIAVAMPVDIFIDQGQGFTFSLAVSDSGTLTKDTQWSVFTVFDNSIIPDSNGCPGDVTNPVTLGIGWDYPCVGIDQNAVYVAQTAIANVPESWISNSLYVIQKESLYNGDGPVIITAFPNITKTADGNFVGSQDDYRDADSTVQPLNNFDDPNPAFGYALCNDPVFFGRLQLFRILNAGSTSPSLVGPFNIDVMQTYCKIIDPIQGMPFLNQLYGNLGSIATLDDRLADTSQINKKQIYTGHTVRVNNTGLSSASGDRTGIRWYQLDVTGDPTGQGLGTETATTIPALVQAGTLFDTAVSNPLYYAYPAIMSNSQGDISICGTVASVNNSPSAFFVGKAGTDPKDGTLKIGTVPPNVYAVGNGHFVRSITEGIPTASAVGPFIEQRWGDMSYSSVDPVDKKTIWTIQEICSNGLETVVVAQLLAP